jgi:hypothetical protein
MTPHFLLGAILGSGVAVFTMGSPMRRLMQSWQSQRTRKRGD